MSDNVFNLYSAARMGVSSGFRPYVAYGLSMPTNVRVSVNIQRYDSPVFSVEDTFLCNFLILDEECVSLIYSKCMIELRGRNLSHLEGLLKFYVLRFVDIFDRRMHISPTDHEPLITGIRWKTVLQVDERLVPGGKFKSDAWQVMME